MKNKKIIIFLVVLGIFVLSFNVIAAGKQLNVNWPPSPVGTRLTPESELGDLIEYLYEWGIFLGGLAAFIALIIAGFQYLTSVGDPAKMKDAMDRIKSTFFGLVLLLGSWLILNKISPQFTTLQLPPFEPGTTTEIKVATTSLEQMKLPPCTKAEIIRQTTTIVLDETECSSKYIPNFSISTDELFTVQGYIDENATSCSGYVTLYAEKGCNTAVGSFLLSSPSENTHVDKVVQSAQFFSGE